MKAITIRQIDDKIYAKLKAESKKKGPSLNKFIVNCPEKITGIKKQREYDGLNDFFGTWDEEQAQAVNVAVQKNRKIDKDIWQLTKSSLIPIFIATL